MAGLGSSPTALSGFRCWSACIPSLGAVQDGDGDMDLVLVGTQIYVALRNGSSGGYVESALTTSDQVGYFRAFEVVAADLDNDGDTESASSC